MRKWIAGEEWFLGEIDDTTLLDFSLAIVFVSYLITLLSLAIEDVWSYFLLYIFYFLFVSISFASLLRRAS